jgi:hypothetical protein
MCGACLALGGGGSIHTNTYIEIMSYYYFLLP